MDKVAEGIVVAAPRRGDFSGRQSKGHRQERNEFQSSSSRGRPLPIARDSDLSAICVARGALLFGVSTAVVFAALDRSEVPGPARVILAVGP